MSVGAHAFPGGCVGSVTRFPDPTRPGRWAWRVDAEPHVLGRLKRVFARARSEPGAVVLAETPEVARDLAWFMTRFRLHATPHVLGRLESLAAEQDRREALVREVLAPGFTPRPFELAIPARDYQRRAAEMVLRSRSLLLADDVGLGKAQPLDANVLTPSGWKRMGDLKVGDAVIDPDGGSGRVTGVYDRGVRDVYRVTTQDGASAECCREHLWLVQTANDRCRGGSRVLALGDFADRLRLPKRGQPRGARNYFLPLTSPITFDAPKDGLLPLPPYLLGLLLGNGILGEHSVKFSTGDQETLERLGALLPSGVDVVPDRDDPYTYRLSRESSSGPNPLLDSLRQLGLAGCRSWEKFVPGSYLYSRPSDRLDLLRGLMDTDAECRADSTCLYTSCSAALAEAAAELTRSLGGIASIRGRDARYTYKGESREGRRSHVVNVRLPVNPFLLTRKVDRWRPPLLARGIESVEFVGPKPTRCIRVDTARSLYITDGHLVTHNTASAFCVLSDPDTRPAAVVVQAHLARQWRDEARRFLPELNVRIAPSGNPADLFGEKGERPLMHDVVILTYHKLRGLADSLAPRIKSVIFDECQELRHDDSFKYSAARRLAANCAYRLGTSATPIHNYGGEIFNVLDVLRPDTLGTRAEFGREWCDGDAGEKARVKEPKALGSYLRDCGLMLRRTRAEVGRELPPLSVLTQSIDCDLTEIDKIAGSAAELARIVLAQSGFKGEAKMRAAEELSSLVRQATGLAKARFVADFVRMLVEAGEKVVLFGWHHAVYEIWKQRLADLAPSFYTGEQSPTQKHMAKERFLCGATPVFVMSLRSGSGLDGLQGACRNVVFGELDWSPAVHEQAIGRVYRDGQAERVFAYFLVAQAGSDPSISDVLGLKKQQMAGLRDPHADVVEAVQAGAGDHMKRLAELFLAQRGRHAETRPTEPEDDDARVG